jgi:outer membrane protein TolC
LSPPFSNFPGKTVFAGLFDKVQNIGAFRVVHVWLGTENQYRKDENMRLYENLLRVMTSRRVVSGIVPRSEASAGANAQRRGAGRLTTKFFCLFVLWSCCALQGVAQQISNNGTSSEAGLEFSQPTTSRENDAPVTITLQDAIARARSNYAQYLAAVADAKVAHEDRLQARDGMLPSIGYTQQYLGTQGNGRTPNGRYVTNDGVHVYRVWGVFHQDMPAGFFTFSQYKRAAAAEALAEAKAEIARRGLVVTVTKTYYGLIIGQRKYAIAQQAVDQAQNFLNISNLLEKGGEVAHSDVVKAHLQLDQQKLAFQEAQLTLQNAHLALAVLLSPTLNENFTAVDDLDNTPGVPPFAEVRALAERENQDVRAAMDALRQAKADVTIARAGFFPTLSFDADYGIEANALALHSASAALKDFGPLPNLGYFFTASLNVPVWNWGATHSKLRQAEYRREQARIELSQTQREALSNLKSFYNEAATAHSEAGTLREAADYAAESLRLTTLRYQASEATALEVVDAQTALATARGAFADGQARYRLALATLQTLTGNF